MVTNSFGFIVIRHVNNALTDKYWKLSYHCIRKYHPDTEIVIIDDNSNYTFVDVHFETTLHNTTIIKSAYQQRGEMLPYLYLSEKRFFDIAVILQDSVFLNKNIDLNLNPNENYKFIWEFEHDWDDDHTEITLLSHLTNNAGLIELYRNKTKWKGCFGSMSVVRLSFLQKVHTNHNITNLIPHITCRAKRSCFERIIACVLQHNDTNQFRGSLLGNIHKYCPWGVHWHQRKYFSHLPIIKVWTGR